uniref:Leucine-rich repeat-containing N-terminal plant-type domain-containing protein n=1 Tax=Manihot esculenta TaxID=3983 RepID=A0A2C9UM17_MANES
MLLEPLGAFTNLETLYISRSDLKGIRFAQGSNLTNLKELCLDSSSVDENFLQSFEALSSLETLSMYGCGPSGIIPVSQSICKLKHLQKLDIIYNDFSGNLPLCLANLTSLQQLDLSSNHFIGNISSSPLEGLTNLEYLSVSDNFFQIPISLSPFFNHSKLKYVESWGNKIFAETNDQYLNPRFQLEDLILSSGGYGGAFPKFLYHQHDLQFIDLSHIQMSEGFPYWLLQNNTKLESLYLINNSLSGPLKLPIHSHMNLSELDISDNFFQGFITPEIGTYLPKLWRLNMSGNGFSGSIPSSFGNMSLLELLDLSNNRLSGTIPEDLTIGCVSLQELILSNNSLQGQIFSETSNLRFLYELQLDGNQFTGSIPHSLSNSSFLRVLDLSHNNLYGRIPRWLGNMYFLRVLDLSMNNISGSLPSNFCPSNIQEIYLSRNGLQGSLEDAFYGCSELIVLDLGHNHMTGSIPSWIGKFSRLSYLILGHNYIDGEIPVQLCNLTQLSLLDLSHNHLFDSILPCLRSTSQTYRQLGRMLPNPYNASMDKPLEFTTKSISYSYQGRMLSYISGIDLSCLPYMLNYSTVNDNFLRIIGVLSSLTTLSVPTVDLIAHHLLSKSLTTLQDLDLLVNFFQIPISLSPSKLKYLKSSDNKNSIFIGNMSLLERLDFSENRLQNNIFGSLSSNFCPKDLTEVHLFKNMLQGLLKDSFHNCPSLVVLDLSHNRLIWRIPKWIGEIPLSYILLSQNHFEGEIPIQLCKLDKLSLIDLSHKNLSGHIPHCLSCSSWYEKREKSNQPRRFFNPETGVSVQLQQAVEFSTMYSSYFYQASILRYFSGIDLSCNFLTVDRSNPITFSNLGQIESLDLSYNNLEGKIPPQLTRLYSLAVFSVAHKNFSGKTSERVAQFATFDQNSYERNPLLCGLPLLKSCNNTSPVTCNSNRRNLWTWVFSMMNNEMKNLYINRVVNGFGGFNRIKNQDDLRQLTIDEEEDVIVPIKSYRNIPIITYNFCMDASNHTPANVNLTSNCEAARPVKENQKSE